MSIKVGFVSLGCPKNLINTEVMLAKLVDHGMEIVAEDIDADGNNICDSALYPCCDSVFQPPYAQCV